MENKVIWKIRNKETGEFLNNRNRNIKFWLKKPTEFLRYNPLLYKERYEFVKYIWELKEVTTEEIKL